MGELKLARMVCDLLCFGRPFWGRCVRPRYSFSSRTDGYSNDSLKTSSLTYAMPSVDLLDIDLYSF